MEPISIKILKIVESLKLRNFEIKQPRNQKETKKPRNQEAWKSRNKKTGYQETKKTAEPVKSSWFNTFHIFYAPKGFRKGAEQSLQ